MAQTRVACLETWDNISNLPPLMENEEMYGVEMSLPIGHKKYKTKPESCY
jgi:hypothetical protein